eukprot:571831-Prymnesium_polylepis.1
MQNSTDATAGLANSSFSLKTTIEALQARRNSNCHINATKAAPAHACGPRPRRDQPLRTPADPGHVVISACARLRTLATS